MPLNAIFKLFDCLIAFLSSEWMLTHAKRPNGGTIVLLRSLLTSAWFYVIVLGIQNFLDPSRTWTLSAQELLAQASAHLSWWGTIFAATYAALYARFASQWNYLANLYNTIKSAECRSEPPTPTRQPGALEELKAGFIEDAIELHLATKPIFAAVVYLWNSDPLIKQTLHATALNPKKLIPVLEEVEALWKLNHPPPHGP